MKKFYRILLIIGIIYIISVSSPAMAFPANSSFTLTAVGDIMLHAEQSDGAIREDGTFDFTGYFALLGERLSHADITIGNLETPVVPEQPTGGFPYFNAPVELLEVTAAAGFDIVSVCNNHSLDMDLEGAIETVRQVKAHGIAPIGVVELETEYFSPYIQEINGIKVAFLAYTEHLNGHERHYKKGELDRAVKLFDKEEAAFDIALAKRAGADVVAIMIHWGTEYVTEPSSRIRKLAEELAVTGADIILGSHPHVVQPCEIITVQRADGKDHDAFVAYSLGNIISNQTLVPTQYGVIVDVEVEYNFAEKQVSFTSAGYSPTYVWKRRKPENKNLYLYSVVACDDFTDVMADGMTDSDLRHFERANKHVTSLMEQTNVPVFDYYQFTGLTRPVAPAAQE